MEENKELDLAAIAKEIKLHARYVWSKKLWITGISFFCGILFFFYAISREPLYEAPLTYMVNDDDGSGGGGGGLSAILGQFGLYGGGGGGYNYLKIVEISKSEMIMKQVLFDSCYIAGKMDLVANHIISAYEMHDSWNEDTLLYDFIFPSNPSLQTRKERIATKILVGKLRGNPDDAGSKKMISSYFLEESGILKIVGSTKNADLSIILANKLFEKLSDFYISKSVERQKTTYDQLTQKVDSIGRLISSSERSLANFSDQSKGVLLNQNRIPLARNQRKLQMYGVMYEEALRNQQTAEFLLNSQTPFFQVIDTPYLPLKNVNRLKIMQLIVVVIVSSLLLILVLVGLKFVEKEIKPKLA